MARRTASTGSDLFKETTVQQWLDVFKEENVRVDAVDREKRQIRINCIHPNHVDTGASARLDLEYGNYHCWSCDADRIFDPLSLLSIITNTPHNKLRQYFADHFGLTITYRAINQENDDYAEDTSLLADFVDFGRWALKSVYDDFQKTNGDETQSVLPTLPVLVSRYYKAIQWLQTKDIELADLTFLNIGLLVGIGDVQRWIQDWMLLNQRRKIEEIVPFTQNYKDFFGKVAVTEHTGALLFPHYVTPKRVGRIQARIDFLAPPALPGQTKDPFRFVFVEPADDAPSHIQRLLKSATGFYGLDMLRHWPRQAIAKGVYMTEGATDTIAVTLAQWRLHQSVLRPSIGVAGTGQTDVDSLSALGIDHIWMLQDAPHAKGDTIAQVYIKKAKKIDMSIFSWPSGYEKYKDMFDIYKKGGASALFTAITKDSNFLSAVNYMRQKFEADIADQGPQAAENIFAEYVASLGGDATKRAFIDAVSEDHEFLKSEDIERSIVGIDDDTVDGFLKRIIRDLDRHYEFLFKEQERTTDTIRENITFREKETRRIIKIPYTMSAIESTIMMKFGGPWQWAIAAHMPSDMLYRTVGKQRKQKSPTAVMPDMKNSVKAALDTIVRALDTPDNGRFGHLSNGVHSITEVLPSEDGANTAVEKILIVNGAYCFIGEFQENGDISWKDYMPFLRDDPTYGTARWTNDILSVEDLAHGNTVDMSYVWDSYHKIIDTGWGFQDQEADAIWLTALAIYSAVYDFQDRTLMTVITADRSSGKSKLVKDMFAGHGQPRYGMPVVPFFHYAEFPSSSPVGIEQTFGGAKGIMKRGLVLDEFENDSPRASDKMDRFFGMIRGMLDGETTVHKGTRSGIARDIVLRFPVLLAGILEFEDTTGAVRSRVYRIEMAHDPTRKSPRAMVRDVHGKLDAVAITRDLTVGVYRHAIRLRNEVDRFEDLMSQEDFGMQSMPIKPESRTQKSIATIAGIMSICGKNDQEVESACALLFKKTVAKNAPEAEKPGERIWNAMMSYTVAIPDGKTPGLTGIMSPGSRLSKISLIDAILDANLRYNIGENDFFPGFHVVDERYLVIDPFYLRTFFEQNLGRQWDNAVTLLARCYTVMPHDRAVPIAVKANRKFYAKSKKFTVVLLPVELSDVIALRDAKDTDTKESNDVSPTRDGQMGDV